MSASKETEGGVDIPTLAALSILAYAIANVAHEGFGHGGACLIVGGKPIELNAVYFDCYENLMTPAAGKWVSAGGTLVNFAVGGAAWAGLRREGPAATPGRYFLWLLMTVSFLQGTGYWLFSGLGNIGDWANVIDGLTPAWPWRVLLSLVGAAGYVATIGLSLRMLAPFVGGELVRVSRAKTLTLIPYMVGGALYVTAGLFNPVSPALVLISGAAASLGGTSALAWAYNLLRSPKRFTPVEAPPLSIPRSGRLLAVGAATALVFIVILGRSVRF